MATYDLTRTELDSLLSTTGGVTDPAIRDEVAATLEEAGVYTGPGSEANTVVVDDGLNPDDPNVIIYTDNVSGPIGAIPTDPTALIFASDDGVIASIDGSGEKIVVSGDGNDVFFMTGDSSDKIFAGGGARYCVRGRRRRHRLWRRRRRYHLRRSR